MTRRPQAQARQAETPQRSAAARWLARGAMGLVAFTAVAWTVTKVFDPGTVPVQTVRVTTPLQRVQAEQLRQVVLPLAEAGLLRIDLAAVREATEAMPWVRRAAVKRRWPDALEIEVEEQETLAKWGERLINTHGEVFDGTTAEDRLPEFGGPEGSEGMVAQQFREMSRILGPTGLVIREVSMDERRAWTVRLDNGWQLALGRSETYPRLLRFVRVYPAVLRAKTDEILGVDLRYTNGFAVRWRTGVKAAA